MNEEILVSLSAKEIDLIDKGLCMCEQSYINPNEIGEIHRLRMYLLGKYNDLQN